MGSLVRSVQSVKSVSGTLETPETSSQTEVQKKDMVATNETIAAVEDATGAYKYGFVTDIETEKAPKGLNEDIIAFIFAKDEPEWMLEWWLKAYRHWLKMASPDWAKLNIPEIDYQDAYYYASVAPKSAEGPKIAG